jgi:hypothetical protein
VNQEANFADDPYVYPGTSILRNFAELRDEKRVLAENPGTQAKRREISLCAGRRIRTSECGRKRIGLLRSK